MNCSRIPHLSFLKVVLSLCVFLTTSQAMATDAIMARVPNTNTFSCNTCHQAGARTALNAFGASVQDYLVYESNNPIVDWSTLWNMDADEDGQTNGEELGDPCGSWAFGANELPAREDDISHPGCNPATALGNHCSSANFLPYTAEYPNAGTPVWFYDGDGDGVGLTDQSATLCHMPEDYVSVGGDCDDSSAQITTFLWYADLDDDGYGNPAAPNTECVMPENHTTQAGDCDDTDPNKFDSVDLFFDEDSDGYGAGDAISFCVGNEPLLFYSEVGTDCAPTEAIYIASARVFWTWTRMVTLTLTVRKSVLVIRHPYFAGDALGDARLRRH